jgi:hypothetical protein
LITKTIVLSIVLVLFGHSTYAQDSLQLNGRTLSKNQLIEDYDILYSTLVNYHAAPYLYINEDELKQYYLEQRESFPDSLTELEFNLIARDLIAKIKCGHTLGKPSDEWYASLKGKSILLPFIIKRIDDKIYFKSTTKDTFDFKVNDELLRLNNIPIKDILERMATNQNRDGHTLAFVNEKIVSTFRTYYLFLNGYQKEILVEYKTTNGEIKQSKVKSTNKRIKSVSKPNLPENLKEVFKNKWSDFAIDSTTSIAYLKIKTFTDRKEYKKYYKEVFKYLDQASVSHLIIDLRDNGGGYFMNGNKLLTYLTPEKFEHNMQKPKRIVEENEYTKMEKWTKLTNFAFLIKPRKYRSDEHKTITFSYKPSKYRFKGQVHVINNGNTFSQASLTTAHLKEYGAMMYGTETGGTENGTNCMIQYQLVLPNSKLSITVPHYRVISNSTKGESGYGVKADIELQPIANTDEDHILMEVLKAVAKAKK